MFITGASRGIGKAIALKAAADGANIVIAAKTAEPHVSIIGLFHWIGVLEVDWVGMIWIRGLWTEIPTLDVQ